LYINKTDGLGITAVLLKVAKHTIIYLF